jgi:hypothetical protein
LGEVVGGGALGAGEVDGGGGAGSAAFHGIFCSKAQPRG